MEEKTTLAGKEAAGTCVVLLAKIVAPAMEAVIVGGVVSATAGNHSKSPQADSVAATAIIISIFTFFMSDALIILSFLILFCPRLCQTCFHRRNSFIH